MGERGEFLNADSKEEGVRTGIGRFAIRDDNRNQAATVPPEAIQRRGVARSLVLWLSRECNP